MPIVTAQGYVCPFTVALIEIAPESVALAVKVLVATPVLLLVVDVLVKLPKLPPLVIAQVTALLAGTPVSVKVLVEPLATIAGLALKPAGVVGLVVTPNCAPVYVCVVSPICSVMVEFALMPAAVTLKRPSLPLTLRMEFAA